MKKTTDFRTSLKRWVSGKVDFTLALEEKSASLPLTSETKPKRGEPHLSKRVENAEKSFWEHAYHVLGCIFCAVFIGTLIVTVMHLPAFGADDVPAVNEVVERYVEKGMEETGAVNAVAGMILDYRAFDTLGESFVLFTACCSVIILLKGTKVKGRSRERIINYEKDPIVRTVSSFLIPLIFVMGIYVILNGHLSPGGGFSGGAMLGAGFILYGMVFGEDKVARFMNEKVIRVVVLCALGFYALAKSYSFYTGANHLESVITPGVPGRIISAGLIMPLDVAVGAVVCCTMYSFYMLFRRGKI